MNINQRKWEWIGTKWDIKRISDNDQTNIYISSQIPQLISDFNSKYSRFDNNSLISKINQDRESLNIDIETRDILTQIMKYISISDGYFDPFVWSDLEQLGYDSSYSFQSKQDQSEYISNIHKSVITLIWNNVYISGNQKIEFGGIGKWYLIDKIKRLFTSNEVNSFVINGGWDIYISDLDWNFGKIGIQNPLDQSQVVWYIWSNKWAVAASGWLYRTRGKWLHHLIDPHTHLPVNDTRRSMHIYCDDIILADVASTILSVVPLDQVHIYAANFDVQWMIIFEDLSVQMSEDFPWEWIE